MTESQTVNQATQEQKTSDKEINFRAIEAKHRREIEQERQARVELERRLQEIESRKQIDDDDDNEPYVDHKKLDKKLTSFEKKLEERFEKKVDERARALLEQKEEENWLKSNNDFQDVLNEENLTRFLNKAPAMAESIKRMPDGFEKQKLVYNAIKSMGLDKPEPKQSTVQDKIDANRRSPYYQPSGVASAPYAMAGDFSQSGQKNAYAKMQELKNRLQR
jgi:hypothetical protein